ncbi:MAG: prephenate dehydrogenase/arogenate dehydrogenase family protein, partial [Nitrospirota bacterium]
MDFKKITLIGVGLIGSSFALALKKHGFDGVITGVGRNEQNLVNAKKLGIIDAYCTSPSEGVIDADLIVLA